MRRFSDSEQLQQRGIVMILQFATALAIGAYAVLSKDAQPKRPDATPREPFQRPEDHLIATVALSSRSAGGRGG